MPEIFYHKITDKQWKIIEPCLPQAKSGGRPALGSRTVFNAILWILGSGFCIFYLFDDKKILC